MCLSLAIWIFLAPQDQSAHHAREFVEKLRSEKVEEREEATRRLKEMGIAAVSELEKAARDRDVEVAIRARHLLRLIDIAVKVPSELAKALPGFEERLLREEGFIWTKLFHQAVVTMPSGRILTGIGIDEIKTLATLAVREARAPDEKLQVCSEFGSNWIRYACPSI